MDIKLNQVLPVLATLSWVILLAPVSAFGQTESEHKSDQRPERLWRLIEASDLPSDYRGATHQKFVDAEMAKLTPSERGRVGELWQQRRNSNPSMTNPGASFVKVMMFVAAGETIPESVPESEKDWFRPQIVEQPPVFKATGLHTDSMKSSRDVGHPTLLSPHSDPLAIQGQTLFVVNTPADTLDVIDTQLNKVTASVPVGIDPVCVAVRPDGKEVWVSNYVSDTVSVVDNDGNSPTYLCVVATIQDIDLRKKSTRFDEPAGIAFAGNAKAYVALASTNRIAVIDVASRKVVSHINVPSQEPRLLRVRDSKLYVAPFESNNQTQLSGGDADSIDGHQVTFDAHKLADSFDSAGFTLDIIRHSEIPDRDLYVYDTDADQLIQTVESLGTLQYGFDVAPDGTVMIAHTEARNHVNGRAGTKKHGLKELQNRPYLNRIAVVSPQGKSDFIHLNPLPPTQPDRESAIATPSAIHISGKIAYITAEGSDHLVAVDAKSGEILDRVKVGAVPRGIVVQRQSAWVFNAVDNSVTRVTVSDPTALKVLQTIGLNDPTLARTKAGRVAFHTARASSNGTFSCASCHPNGHTDHLLWVLDTPHIVGADQIEPRLSQQLRGLRGTAPYHWDGIPGDPYGGQNASTHRQLPPNCDINDPVSAVRHLIDGGMATTMLAQKSETINDEGKKGYLSKDERDAMAEFLLDLNHKPPRGRAYTDQLSDRALTGLERFHITGARDKQNLNTMVCGSCHTMPYLTTDQGSMNVPSFRGALDRFITQAQGRNSVISLSGVKQIADKGWRGEEVWKRMLAMGEPKRLRPVIDMFKESSTGFSGAFGRQATLSQQTVFDPLTIDLLPALEKAALEGAVVLKITGRMLPSDDSLTMTFDIQTERFVVDKTGGGSYSTSELLKLAQRGKFIGTLTGYHPSEVRSTPPAIWTIGSLHQQRGVQLFPRIDRDHMEMSISGRHIQSGASLLVNGRRVRGSIESAGEDRVDIKLKELPPRGINTLQVQNRNSYLSNDFIFFVESKAEAIERYRREPDYLLTAILNSAIVNNNPTEARLVLEAGAELNAPHRHFDFERPPIILAAMYGRSELVANLLDRGADPNIQDKDGLTALHEAARLGRLQICKTLIGAGAKLQLNSDDGERPIDLTDHFLTEGNFEKYFAPYRVNLKLDYDRYLRERTEVAKLVEPEPGTTKQPIATGADVDQKQAGTGNTSSITEADWAMYNHDARGWRFNSAETKLSPKNVGSLVEKWRFPPADSKETIGAVHATPSVVNGEVYFGTATFPAFYKLDANGNLLWVYRNQARRTELPPASDGVLGDKLLSTIRAGGTTSSALVIEGAVCFADTGGWIYCLDAKTGAERWKIDTRKAPFPGAHPGYFTQCSPILADGKIIIGGGTIEQMYAGTKAYPGSTGRGFVVAIDPTSGKVIWKFDLGERPRKFDKPFTVQNDWGTTTYTHGPATSSIWCTPSYDEESKSIFFGTDVNTAPRQPTKDNPNLFTEDSDAIICLDVETGKRKWRTQIHEGDQWNNAMRGWDSKTGRYKDCSIGDTPKLLTLTIDDKPTKVVGAGCKNGGFYLLRADDGAIINHTPLYTGPPTEPPAKHDPRVLALPSPIGGLQTGCATDGRRIFTNGIDALRLTTQESPFARNQIPTGGRVTATSVDLKTEFWRHERPKVQVSIGEIKYQRGDIVGSGIAVGNGVAYFTAAGSEKLVALDIDTGAMLREIEIGPVFCGPSLSRGHVYVGTGNTVFSGGKNDASKKHPITTKRKVGGLFPLQIIGSVRCYGLPDKPQPTSERANQ